jgi:hypothetical protein
LFVSHIWLNCLSATSTPSRKWGAGGRGGLYIYKNLATNGSVDVATLIIFISKNGGNKSLKITIFSCCFFHFLEIYIWPSWEISPQSNNNNNKIIVSYISRVLWLLFSSLSHS